MMKKLLLSAIAAIAALTASAQSPWLHIYSTDPSEFVTIPLDRVKEMGVIQYSSTFKNMTVTDLDDNVETIDLQNVSKWLIGANVPQLYITTEPSIGDISDKTTYYDAVISIDGAGVVSDLAETECQLRGRGNSTLHYPKKPYRLKFPEKIKICDFKKAKNYVLLANWIDRSYMRNFVAFKIAELAGLQFANHVIPVDVHLNGFYKGTYMLTEKVGFNNGSVDLTKEDEANSVMIEFDTCDLTAGLEIEHGGLTPNLRVPYQLKDPDAPTDGSADDWWAEWAEEVDDLERAAVNGDDISGMVDLSTLARFMLVYNVACNQELNHPKSVMMWKTRGGKWQFGPAWDFDWAFGYRPTYYGIDYDDKTEADNREKYERALKFIAETYGPGYIGFFTFEGEELICLGDVIYDMQWNEWLSVKKSYLPSYQAPLLGVGKNTQNGPWGRGGEFFMALIEDNDAFMAEYKKVWEELKAKLPEFWAAFNAYSAQLEPTSARDGAVWLYEVSSGTGKENPDEPQKHSTAVKQLKTWLENRFEFIDNEDKNYGLY